MFDLVQEFRDRKAEKKKKRRRKILAVVGIVVAIAGAVAAWVFYSREQETTDVSPTEPPAHEPTLAETSQTSE